MRAHKPMEHVKKVKVANRLGLHARAAAQIAKTAMDFDSDLYISLDGKEVDGKNLLSILSLGAGTGAEIVLRAVGEDSAELIEAVSKLFSLRFGEI